MLIIISLIPGFLGFSEGASGNRNTLDFGWHDVFVNFVVGVISRVAKAVLIKRKLKGVRGLIPVTSFTTTVLSPFHKSTLDRDSALQMVAPIMWSEGKRQTIQNPQRQRRFMYAIRYRYCSPLA